MKESLEKIIKTVLLPKYPLIKDFKISVTKNGENNLYNVRYYIDGVIYDSLFKGDEYGLIKKLTDIESETKSLFNVLGPNKNDMFGVVRSYRYNKRDRNNINIKIIKESLEKLIRKVILPKYDWIKDFNISVTKGLEHDLYYVNYYVDDDIYDGLYVGDKKEIKAIKSETKNLFNVLGPDRYDVFGGVEIRGYKDIMKTRLKKY
jgi:hypothetical protein